MVRIASSLLVGLLWLCGAARAASPRPWWRAAGSLSQYDARWRRAFAAHRENENAFAAALAHNLKSGKGFAYLRQGGVSPDWYRPPLHVPLYRGAYDAALYRLAYRAFVQTRHLTKAYRLALTAIHWRPASHAWRLRLVRVAAWLDQRTQVLRQYQWLARHGDRGARACAVRLAASLSRPDLIVHDLAGAGRLARLSHKQWVILLAAYSRLGAPQRAIAVIDSALRRRFDRYLLEQKADITGQTGEVNRSVATLRRLCALYGFTPRRAMREAKLLSMQGHERQAFAALRASLAQASWNDIPFWHLYAVLAWDTDDTGQVLFAEKTLYLLGAANEYDLQRLIALTQHTNLDAALAVAMDGWRQFHMSVFFFEGAAFAEDRADWPVLARLLQTLSPNAAHRLRQYAAYWVAAAELAAATRRARAAAADYAEALALDPGNAMVENDLLWTLADHGQVADLRTLLAVRTRKTPRTRKVLASIACIVREPCPVRTLLVPVVSARMTLNRAGQLAAQGARGAAWVLREDVVHRMAAQMLRSVGRAVAP